MQKKRQLYSYYKERGILPTYARFKTAGDLRRYAAQREEIFRDKLHLPAQMFEGSRLVEFGPDSGENSLVFAGWGAELVLVEPNSGAWQHITGYFDRFGLSQKLLSLKKTDLQKFKTRNKFRFIDAEGFIYTIRPESLWLRLFHNILEKNGFFIIFYCEKAGSFLELVLKLIHTRAKKLTGLDSRTIAWKLFREKWGSIPHTRSFDSWVMDVLDNPFVRSKYLFSAASIYTKAVKTGFSFYSSWPSYRDGLAVYWHKKQIAPEEKISGDIDFINRSCMSFAFGKKMFLCSGSQKSIKKASKALRQLVSLVDRSIDAFDASLLKRASGCLDTVKMIIKSKEVLTDSFRDKKEALALCGSIDKIFKILIKGDTGGLIKFCNSDPLFIRSWGQPYHCVVFRKK